MENHNILIKEQIKESLLIPLYMRAIESLSPNPIIKDKTACKLIDTINYNFKKFNNTPFSTRGSAIRANNFDNKVIQFIENNEDPIIVLVGCGLDSRRERIGEFAEKATFYLLDTDETISIREQLIPKFDNETFIKSPILETNWITSLAKKHKNSNFMFVIEGILMYFDKQEVKKIIQNIAYNFSNSELVFDVISVWLNTPNKQQNDVKDTKTEFKFDIDNDKILEEWANNIKLMTSESYIDLPKLKQTGFKGWIKNFIPKYKKTNRMIHYRMIHYRIN